jgi:hypothetical protein
MTRQKEEKEQTGRTVTGRLDFLTRIHYTVKSKKLRLGITTKKLAEEDGNRYNKLVLEKKRLTE